MVTHISTVWESLRYVDSANTRQTDWYTSDIALACKWGTELRPDNAQRRVITTTSMLPQLNL